MAATCSWYSIPTLFFDVGTSRPLSFSNGTSEGGAGAEGRRPAFGQPCCVRFLCNQQVGIGMQSGSSQPLFFWARRLSACEMTQRQKNRKRTAELDTIVVKGAREHNLKHVDIELPKKRLIVFTGVSGSGKSSLAFDTIFAEGQAHGFLSGLTLTGNRRLIGKELIKEIGNRLRFLINVGLDYLSLSRKGPTLSGGESQRIRLASQVGSELTGVLYILDEPSIGLHQRDNIRLLETLSHLRDIGNTLIVIEHDRETMETADWIVDIGPGAGLLGGQIVAQGTPAAIRRNPRSVTGRYLAGKEDIPCPAERRRPRRDEPSWLTIHGARQNNLANITVPIPLELLVAVTGVSGAGKSTLINQVLYPALARHLHGSDLEMGHHDASKGWNVSTR